jgi:hypothetical protein
MGLDDLGKIHQTTQFLCRLRDLHRQDLVARSGSREEVTHGADATDPCRNRGHLGEGSALTEFFKAPVFADVEAGISHLTVFGQVDRDLGVTFNPGDRINRDGAVLVHR